MREMLLRFDLRIACRIPTLRTTVFRNDLCSCIPPSSAHCRWCTVYHRHTYMPDRQNPLSVCEIFIVKIFYLYWGKIQQLLDSFVRQLLRRKKHVRFLEQITKQYLHCFFKHDQLFTIKIMLYGESWIFPAHLCKVKIVLQRNQCNQ